MKGSATPTAVTTSPSTKFTRTTAAAAADAAVGNLVVAEGNRQANGSLAATALAILPSPEGGSRSGIVLDPGSGVGSALDPGGAARSQAQAVLPAVASAVADSLALSQTVADSLSMTTGAAVQAAGVGVSGSNLAARLVHIGPFSLGLDLSGSVPHPGTPGATSTTIPSGSPSTSTSTPAGTSGGMAIVQPGLAIGTVASVNGSGFTLTVAGSPVPKIVTTSARTQLTMTVAGSVSAAVVDTAIIATGGRVANGALAARQLSVLPAVQLPPSAGAALSQLPASVSAALGGVTNLDALPGLADLPVVFGTVAANHHGTLTVTTLFGPLTVTTSPSTAVTVTKAVGIFAVTVGTKVQVAGTVGADGSLEANAVHIGRH